MRDLRLVGVDDEGTRLQLVDDEGQQYQVELNDALRDAVRAPRSRGAQADVDPNIRPRDVQSMLRSGLTIDEVAERTGWTTTKVGLFEPPIRAERDHVAITAQRLQLHTRVGGRDQVTTVGERVAERLLDRDVSENDAQWDAWRTERGWTIVCRFVAGGRDRVATWRYDATTQSLNPLDDESRWLSEDNHSGANPFGQAPASTAGVYDVVAEGGLDQSKPASKRGRATAHKIPHATVTPAEAETEAGEAPPAAETAEEESDRPVDLVSVMRERSKNRRRSRRKSDESSAKKNEPAHSEEPEAASEPEDSTDEKSVDDLGHDPVTGTADLFGLQEVEDLPESAVEVDEVDEVAADETVADIEPELVVDDEDADDAPASESADEEAIPQRPSEARKGRPAVPSWDDIMFGKRGPNS